MGFVAPLQSEHFFFDCQLASAGIAAILSPWQNSVKDPITATPWMDFADSLIQFCKGPVSGIARSDWADAQRSPSTSRKVSNLHEDSNTDTELDAAVQPDADD
jgi:hypothetical protein